MGNLSGLLDLLKMLAVFCLISVGLFGLYKKLINNFFFHPHAILAYVFLSGLYRVSGTTHAH
jgi:hypothetical protein